MLETIKTIRELAIFLITDETALRRIDPDVYSGDTDPPFRSILTPLGGSSFKEHRVVQYYLFLLNDSPFISILIV